MKAVLLCVLWMSAFSISAKTLIISDIDDTIRQSNILKKWDMLKRWMKNPPAYKQMQKFYQQWYTRGDVDFIYLSSSYPFLYKAPKWLDLHEFPKGETIQRVSWQQSSEYKMEQLHHIMTEQGHDFDRIILIGDNSQEDPNIYLNISKSFAYLPIEIFIRDTRVNANNYDRRLKTSGLEGVSYFLSVLDFWSYPGFHWVKETLKKETTILARKNRLVPDYTYDQLKSRIKNEICEKLETKLKKKECHSSLKRQAKDIVKKYFRL